MAIDCEIVNRILRFNIPLFNLRLKCYLCAN